MQPPHNRTIICSVVYLDVVGYSKMWVTKQQRIKSAFNDVVNEAMARIPVDERIILDTGDGAALCFMGDPEDALFVAMDVAAGFRDRMADEDPPPPQLRTGINLGPVRLVQDLSGRTNLIGDGINVGQRIMSFAEPDQILVSRSYFEVVGVLSSKHAALFRYQGTRKDKHVREHSVYEIRLGEEGAEPEHEMGGSAAGPLALDPSSVDAMQEDLTRAVGPLAAVLVRRYLASSATEAEFVASLAKAIPEGQARTDFLRRWQSSATSTPPPGPAPAVGTIGHAASETGRRWSDAELGQVEAALARQMGPLAGMLTHKATQQCSTLDGLIEHLAAQIADPGQRARFVQDAPRRLGGPRTH